MNPQYYGAAAEYNKPKGTKLLSGKLLLIAGIGLVGLVVALVLFTIFTSIASGPRNDVARLTARTQRLKDVIRNEVKAVKNSELKKASSEAGLYLSTGSLALQNAFSGTLPEAIVAEEADPTVATRLAAAVKAGRHDEQFLAILKEKVALTLELAQKVQDQTSGQQTRAAAIQITDSLSVVKNQLDSIEI